MFAKQSNYTNFTFAFLRLTELGMLTSNSVELV